MSTVLQIRSNGQITLPTSVRRQARLKEGELLEVIIEEDGSLRLVPRSPSTALKLIFGRSAGRKVSGRPRKTCMPGASRSLPVSMS